MTSPIIYMIRHGEKPPPDANGNDPDGLSAQGRERAQWLRECFGKDSQYKIGYILAEDPKKDGSRSRPVETITPLATDLGLLPNTSIARDDASGAAAAAKAFAGPGNVLICWEHEQLEDIVEALGVPRAKYPADRFDLIWTVPSPYTRISSVTSEKVPGVDVGSG